MLPRTPRMLWIALLLLIVAAPALHAQAGAGPVRYHFGDQVISGPRLSDPKFDDRAWPLAQDGRWPAAPVGSDGIVWTRSRVPVSSLAAGPLALRVSNNFADGISYEIFVNGQQLVQRGSFPPDSQPLPSRAGSVFDLPAGLAAPGATAVVAYRVWLPPIQSLWKSSRDDRFEIGESANLRMANRVDRLKALLTMGPDLAINAVIAILGIGLLIFWRWSGNRDLLLSSGVLLLYSIPAIFVDFAQLGILTVPWHLYGVIYYSLQVPQMAIMMELIWTIHGLRARGLKRLTQALLLVFNFGCLYLSQITAANAAFFWLFAVVGVSVQLFDLIVFGVNMWAFFVRRKNQLIAAALALIPLAATLSRYGIVRHRAVGPFDFDLFNLAFFASSLALFAMLGQRAWQSWRSRDELRAEFEAAREVQQQLVAPAVDVPGFKIESVYAPAKQVGGDFFRVIPEADGALLVVVGDVSGKGLRAAMTVSAIIGALRTMPALAPARILGDLNRGLVGQLRGGFVTCCVARIAVDGAVTIANAGHLSPYRNGVEVDAGAGLPLGISAEVEYEESNFQLQPDESLTFLSDGVVEARNAAGELFGFERTIAISRRSAEAIAQAAVAFGQDDDITVLTLTGLATGQESTSLRTAPALAPA
jgi:Stage II sporulation protein E (SpoIIE)